MKSLVKTAVLCGVLLAGHAWGQTTIRDAWVRGTVAQQLGTGAFMKITSAQGGKLVAAQSPVAKTAEVHEMVMQGDVMAMRAIESLELPAGRQLELKPGGHHLMLLGLKQPIRPGETVPLTLTIEHPDGKRETIEVKAAVRPIGAAAEHKR